MHKNYIEFKRKRELGDIVSDTFGFIRDNFKSLFSILIKTSGIPFIIMIIGVSYYSYSTLNLFDGDFFNGGSFFPAGMLISLVVLFITALIFYGTMFGTILNYIKSYVNNYGLVKQEEVIEGVKKDFGNILGLGFLSGIITVFGFLLCFIPGIYLYVPMSLVFAILVFRNTSVSNAIGESFDLVKNEWWITFATLLVLGILAYIISAILSVPAIIYSFIKGFTMASEGSLSDPSSMFDWVFLVLNVLASIVQYLVFYTINGVSSAFIYFNLNERKNYTGTMERIDSIGKEPLS